MRNTARFLALLTANGSDIRYRRGDSLVPCPCRSPEGFRDPIWHLENPAAPICDENGMLSSPATTRDLIVKGFMQPIQSTRATRLTSEDLLIIFGEVQADDHLGIFPYQWAGVTLNFRDWSSSGEDYVEYAGQRFTIVNSNLIPDTDGDPYHHWEVGARMITGEAL
jgi:hypothetical protein